MNFVWWCKCESGVSGIMLLAEALTEEYYYAMIKTINPRKAAGFLLGILLILPPFLSGTESLSANKCHIGTVWAGGTATAKSKAQRNSKISLMRKLHSQYPGDANSRLRGAISYSCKNPLLWRCRARVKICK